METQNENQKPYNHIDYFAPKVLWMIIGFLLLVVIVGSVYWWKEIKNQSNLETSNKEHENITTESDWKTYTNTEYGFEMKYPQIWPDPDVLKSSSAWGTTVYISDHEVTDGCCKGLQIDITSDKETIKNFSIQEQSPDTLSKKDIVVAGQKAREFVLDTNYSNMEMIYFVYNDRMFLLRIAEGDEIANQILSTFKFTD